MAVAVVPAAPATDVIPTAVMQKVGLKSKDAVRLVSGKGGGAGDKGAGTKASITSMLGMHKLGKKPTALGATVSSAFSLASSSSTKTSSKRKRLPESTHSGGGSGVGGVKANEGSSKRKRGSSKAGSGAAAMNKITSFMRRGGPDTQ
jgi:hypothetical protein